MSFRHVAAYHGGEIGRIIILIILACAKRYSFVCTGHLQILLFLLGLSRLLVISVYAFACNVSFSCVDH